MAQRDHQGLRMYPGETAENMDELQMNTHTNDNVPPTQSISEILKILEREESGSEEEVSRSSFIKFICAWIAPSTRKKE